VARRWQGSKKNFTETKAPACRFRGFHHSPAQAVLEHSDVTNPRRPLLSLGGGRLHHRRGRAPTLVKIKALNAETAATVANATPRAEGQPVVDSARAGASPNLAPGRWIVPPTRQRRRRRNTHITTVRPVGFAVRDTGRLRFNTLSATVYHRSFACIGRYTPPQPPPTTTVLWRRRSYASSLRARRHWHDTMREDYEQRPESVPAVRGRSPRSRGVRAVGVVGAQLRCLE
jgi:hypothetical protein